MKLINPITSEIIRKAEEKDTIREIAKKTRFAYSAVHHWIEELKKSGILNLHKKGNKTIISINKNEIYRAFNELQQAIKEHELDNAFWNFIKKTTLHVRLGKETSAVIWTKGGYITGDFYNKIYYVDVAKEDYPSLSKSLSKYHIQFSKKGKKENTNINRPFVIISIKKGKIARFNKLPIATLNETVRWCRKLGLEPIIEQLSLIYKLPLKEKYAEIFTNV